MLLEVTGILQQTFLQYGTPDSSALDKSSSKTHGSTIHNFGAPTDSVTILGYVYFTELL
jgi:hypothetical protein